MRLDEMMDKEGCEKIHSYRPTEEELSILNDIETMRKILIKGWEYGKALER